MAQLFYSNIQYISMLPLKNSGNTRLQYWDVRLHIDPDLLIQLQRIALFYWYHMTAHKYFSKISGHDLKRLDIKGRPCTFHLLLVRLCNRCGCKISWPQCNWSKASFGSKKEIQLRSVGANPRFSRRSIFHDVEMEHSCCHLPYPGRRQGGRDGF